MLIFIHTYTGYQYLHHKYLVSLLLNLLNMASKTFLQQVNKPQPLRCNQDRYSAALSMYYQLTNRQDVFAEWIEEKFDSCVVNILPEKLGDRLQDQQLRVLGVGSGEGKYHLHVIGVGSGTVAINISSATT